MVTPLFRAAQIKGRVSLRSAPALIRRDSAHDKMSFIRCDKKNLRIILAPRLPFFFFFLLISEGPLHVDSASHFRGPGLQTVWSVRWHWSLPCHCHSSLSPSVNTAVSSSAPQRPSTGHVFVALLLKWLEGRARGPLPCCLMNVPKQTSNQIK